MATFWISLSNTSNPVGKRFAGVLIAESCCAVHAMVATRQREDAPQADVIEPFELRDDIRVPAAFMSRFLDWNECAALEQLLKKQIDRSACGPN